MSIKRLLQETVTIKAQTGTDAWGKPTFDAGTDYDARVQEQREVVKTTEGQEVLSTVQVYINGDATVGPNSQVTLPDGRQPDIITIRKPKSASGTVHHTKISLE